MTKMVVILTAFHRNALQNNRSALGHEENFLLNSMDASGSEETRRRFVERFVSEEETSVVHRHQFSRAQFKERVDGLFRIHVDFAPGRRVVSADREQRDFDLISLADLFEAGKIRAVAAMKNSAAIHVDDEAAESAMQIGEKACAPMGAGRQRDLQRPELHFLPVIELVHDVEAEAVHEMAAPNRA